MKVGIPPVLVVTKARTPYDTCGRSVIGLTSIQRVDFRGISRWCHLKNYLLSPDNAVLEIVAALGPACHTGRLRADLAPNNTVREYPIAIKSYRTSIVHTNDSGVIVVIC